MRDDWPEPRRAPGDPPAVELPVRPLSRAAFAPFGDVIETDGATHYPINEGSCLRFHDLARVTADAGGRPSINIFRARPVVWPLVIEQVERHPLGSQAFYPLERRPYLVVVAAPDPVSSALVPLAFLASGRQGVNYRPGVWHHPLLALASESEFLVIDRIGSQPNCEEAR
ncbi:MAG: ureidoglycolate lyase, partial [Candidatus Competibacter sp.]|nr:ureidoglycolate lyase [Candidatus Competibacter sp.]